MVIIPKFMIKKDVFGLRIRIMSEDRTFYEMAQNTLASFNKPIGENISYDLDVKFLGCNRYIRTIKKNFDKQEYSKLGTGLYFNKNTFVWDSNEFFVEMKVGKSLQIKAHYNERLDRSIRSDFLFRKDIRIGLYQNILRVLVLHPIFYLLEKEQGKYVLHSSLVEKDGKSICFIGYNGAGKSSIAYYLSRNMEYNLLSDNFSFYDDNYLYALPETIRISKDSLLGMNINSVNNALYSTNGKINIKNEVKKLRTRPIAFVFCRIGTENKARLNQISNVKLVNWTISMHDYIKEFHNYSFAAALNHVDKMTKEDEILACKKVATLVNLTSEVPCFELINNNNFDFKNAAQEVLYGIFNK